MSVTESSITGTCPHYRVCELPTNATNTSAPPHRRNYHRRQISQSIVQDDRTSWLSAAALAFTSRRRTFSVSSRYSGTTASLRPQILATAGSGEAGTCERLPTAGLHLTLGLGWAARGQGKFRLLTPWYCTYSLPILFRWCARRCSRGGRCDMHPWIEDNQFRTCQCETLDMGR